MKDSIRKIVYGGGMFFDLTKWIILIIIFLVLINSFWISVFIVDGISMEPTLHDREVVLYNKAFYREARTPERGDQVVVRYPGDPNNKSYVKRVIALPNEKVQVSGGKVFINGKVLVESYLPYGLETDKDGSWTLSKKEFFLMGDNRLNSNDSRYFGVVEQRFFVGRAFFVLIPRFINLESPTYKL